MLRNRSLDDRTYEELMAEALMQIPLYSEEWTNYNPSDPGMTILENLTAFEILQQNRINQITPAIQQKLLKLAGFEARKGRCARVLLTAENLREPLTLPANQKFHLGDLNFETNRTIRLSPCRVTGVYSIQGEKVTDYSHLADREVRVPAYIFGEHPKEGDSVLFTASGMPAPGEEIIFSVAVADRYNRNPFTETGSNPFAALKWECYTEHGFEEMNVRDLTGCFLVSGEIRMRLPDTAAVPCKDAPDGGYAIRATLVRAEYDVRPKLVSVDGFLFDVWQKDTLAACYTFNRVSSATLSSGLLADGYLLVFAKEEKGASYRRYYPVSGESREKGRLCEERWDEDGSRTWFFNRKRFGYGPEKIKNAIKVAVYSEEMMRRYFLGTVLGVDHQEIALPVSHVVAESFCIIAKRTDEEGEELYDFVRPNRFGEDDLTYHLYENEGKIRIEDAGGFIGAELYIGTISVTGGAEGNVREGNEFLAPGLPSSIRFYNASAGSGGCYRESLEEVKTRFLKDLKTPYTAVTAADYEKLVRETPGLCIHKVKAFMDRRRNMVRIAVKPGTDDPFPTLSDHYRGVIERYLSDKRLLTTKLEIVSPVYVPVDVHGLIYVKRQYENSRELIEEAIRRQIDYIHSDRNFGELLKFDELFREIEALDCVEFIYELSMQPRQSYLASMRDGDVAPVENCLCYPGEMALETATYGK